MIRYVRVLFLFVIALLLLQTSVQTVSFAFSQPSLRQSSNQPYVLVFPLESITWQDIRNPMYPGFQLLLQTGSVGLMNVNTKAGYDRWSEYASAVMGEPTKQPVVKSMLMQNRAVFGMALGQLGELLQKNRIPRFYIGSQQVVPSALDPAELFVIDSSRLENQSVTVQTQSPYWLPDPAAPCGIRDNVQRIVSDVKRVLDTGSGGLIAIGVGDLARLESESSHLSPAQYSAFRKQALAEINAILLQLLPDCHDNVTLIVMGMPVHGTQTTIGDRLAPFGMVGSMMQAGGLVTSATTHRTGLVALVDLLPTLLAQLGLRSEPTLGNPIVSTPVPKSAKPVANAMELSFVRSSNGVYVDDWYGWNLWYSTHREIWIIGLAILTLLGMGMCIGLCLKGKKLWIGNTFASSICIGLSMLPPMLLLEAWWMRWLIVTQQIEWLQQDQWHGIVLFSFLFFVTLVAVRRVRDWNSRLLFLGIVAVLSELGLLMVQDLAFSQSILGYDPLHGARYYGIGNEYMAGLVAFEMIVLTACFQTFGKRSAILYWACAAAFMMALASTRLGANMGGAVTAGMGNAILLYRLHKGGWDRGGMVVCGAALLLTFGCIIGLHAVPGYSQTHAGRILYWMKRSNWPPIQQILLQKIHLNVRMLFARPFWVAVGAGLFLLLGWLLKRQHTVRRWKLEHATWYQLAISLFWTAWIGFFTNDSGIVVVLLLLYSPACLGIAWAVSKKG
jgi:hypothetical protein